MVHGDDRGLKLPPKIAPIQTVIVPILGKESEMVLDKARELYSLLKEEVRVELDDRNEYTPGWKFNEWEMKGVPVRIEIGPRDIKNGQVVFVRRDTGEKIAVSEAELVPRLKSLLDDIQANMFKQAKDFLNSNIREVDNFDEFKQIIEEKRGFIKAHWCGSSECEQKVKEETGATLRCIPFNQDSPEGKCIVCNKASDKVVYFAKSY